MNNNTQSPELITNIFNGSLVLISICLVIVTMFQISNNAEERIVDEFLEVTSILYFISTISAYMYMKEGQIIVFYKLTKNAFMFAVIATVISMIILFFEL
ncbi:hypothetical protein [Flammeovirga pacifica]|uniref:Uncharacterized protein n=1 Tax=Flammeovirga pacifica TaxID=915059 RepID=A0A1S1YSH3_FLAPC|nr:hypothetical protein [Flammeovirga pacifica]OHX63977.1 hypothetical protein NH26_20415 [Flammeovirga pacifica]